MRPTINTEKHIVQQSLAAVASGAISFVEFIDAKANPSAATPADCREGCVVSAIYIEMWATSDDATAGTTICTVERLPSGRASMSAAQSAALDGYDNKKNVLNIMMGLIGPNTQYPMNLVKGWFKIPKGKQRFGIGDRLGLNIHAQSNGMSFCGFATYKEQY